MHRAQVRPKNYTYHDGNRLNRTEPLLFVNKKDVVSIC